ncbi:MAG: competence/damage-inducible protein A [Oscillospiraceae bacterium]|jgi:nicotinamide-nucleotide amidase|nr:competence/damage-inducible protein A [Oscillospiraceae bacterium]
MFTAETISVGTELLMGEILDTNARFLARELKNLGIAVLRQTVVGDNPGRLADAMRCALSRTDIVICTGGLGPTEDDITKETLAKVLGVPLETDPEMLRMIESYFRARKIPMGETNKKQALIPVGGEALPNENGTAPGCYIRHGKGCVALLPGPPGEMKALFRKELLPLLKDYSSGTLVSHYVKVIGLGESRMAELAYAYLHMDNPTVAPYFKDGECYLRVTASGATEEAAERIAAPVVKKLLRLLGVNAYGVDISLAEAVIGLLKDKGKTVALAESCTGGGIGALLTDVPGASDVFGYGIVSYSNECKEKVLGVNPDTLKSFGAVSKECAQEMALGALALSGADCAVAVTGIAGPTGIGNANPAGNGNAVPARAGNAGSAAKPKASEKPAGLIFICATDGKRFEHIRLDTGRNDRGYNRTLAGKQALEALRKLLLKPEMRR